MAAKNILVLAIDGLRASALGAYGNTSYPTPALDDLAAESFLSDACFTDTCDLTAIYRELWQARHPLRPGSAGTEIESLPSRLAAAGYATTLVTDDARIGSLPVSAEFADRIEVSPASRVRTTEVSQTAIAQLFAAVWAQIESAAAHRDPALPYPQFIWAHARALYGAWDAPLEFQERLLEQEEGDPSPCESIEPPDFLLSADHDPDASFVASCGYAAQVMALDACLDGLWQSLAEANVLDDWLILLLGVRAFSLGEHDQVGGCDDRLYAEAHHVPMMWRFPDGTGRLARSGELVSPMDLYPTLLDWADGDEEVNSCVDSWSLLPLTTSVDAPWREALVSANRTGRRAIRTADWCLHCVRPAGVAQQSRTDFDQRADAGPEFELYVRPDDRWEANDVAALCPDVIDELAERLARISGRLQSGESTADDSIR